MVKALYSHIYMVFFIISGTMTFSVVAGAQSYSYAVVISKAAYSDTGWKAVADSLVIKHSKHGAARLFTWSSSVNDAVSALSEFKPDFIGFVARPSSECNAAFIVAVSKLSRKLDDDPYGDAIWGIVTGYEAADALRAISESLTIKTVLAASNNLPYEPPIQRFYQAVGMTCDSYTKTDYIFKDKAGKVYTDDKRPGNEKDRIKLVSSWLNNSAMDLEISGQGKITDPVDCLITGGHGNVNLWQCHYPEAESEGYMQSSGGKLFGAPYSGSSIAIEAPTPKVFWCASNCLMGNPNSKDNIVYAAFHTGHAVQMFGFVNNASGGDEFMAWGVYDRVTKSAGMYTLPQGFFLSNNNAQFELEHPTGQMTNNLVKLFMDSTVFYGDPAADVRFYDVGDSARAYTTSLTFKENKSGSADFTFTVIMKAHDLEFGTGYCYQFRPIGLLPVRIDAGTVVITKNDGHLPVVTDNLIIWEMLADGEKLAKGKSKTVQWSANITDYKTASINMKPLMANEKNTRIRLSLLPGNAETIVRCMNVPLGRFKMRAVDIAGRTLFSEKIISKGTSCQTYRINEKLAPGTCLLMLEMQNSVVHSTIVTKR